LLHTCRRSIHRFTSQAAAFRRARQEGFRLGRFAQGFRALLAHVLKAPRGLLGLGLQTPQRFVEVTGAVARAIALALETDGLGLRVRRLAAELRDLLLLAEQGELLLLQLGFTGGAAGV